ncbi:MAG: aldo/keto reductase [Atopobiaceae bacterium]|jgi:diketogulonate reductase-like aldo/keto reductase|nr:aldo/keto reductase [Atopobiaceae bacterium]
MRSIALSNGVEMPGMGLGVFLAGGRGATENAVAWALEAGYRLIDTAAVYGNEGEVGAGIRRSGVPRADVFVTTKVWNEDIRAGRTRQAALASLSRLGLDYVDLLLLHWPTTGKEEAWGALEELYQEGVTRAIGVSNFHLHHLDDLAATARVSPMFDQVESHPVMTNQALVDALHARGIAVGAWSPLGGPRVNLLGHPALQAVARRYGKTVPQVILRWDIQRQVIAVPKSSKRERIVSNFQVDGFELDGDDMALISSLDLGLRVGPDPENFNF